MTFDSSGVHIAASLWTTLSFGLGFYQKTMVICAEAFAPSWLSCPSVLASTCLKEERMRRQCANAIITTSEKACHLDDTESVADVS